MARKGHITIDTLYDLLSLVIETPPEPSDIRTWTADQRTQAERWARYQHLAASDCRVKKVTTPNFLLDYVHPRLSLQQLRVEPDWGTRGTAKVIKEVFSGIPFTFEGPGVYFHGKDSLLIVPLDGLPNRHDGGLSWRQTWPPETVFVVHVWNDCDISQTFNALCNAPTRHDDR